MQLPNRVFLLALLTSGAQSAWVQMEPSVRVHDASTSSWVHGGRQRNGAEPITLTVAVRICEKRRAELERAFWEVSNPEHENYGKHKTMEDITRLLAVPEDRVQRIRQHFLSAGATSAVVAPNKDMITVTMPVPAAEYALNTTIGVFTHKYHEDRAVMRARAPYFLPADVAKDVIMVGELLQFPRLREKSLEKLTGGGDWPNACASAQCEGLVTPAVLAQRYNLPQTSLSADGSNSMAVAEFQNQFFTESDISEFGTSCQVKDETVAKTIGTNEPYAGVEAELDIEYIKAVAPEVPLTVINSMEYSLINWANEITSMDNAPYVHSVSYGNDEAQQTSTEFMLTCNTAFMKAGARGLSILFASGDQGVEGREGSGSRFHPDFPAGSPYITAVGGTNFEGSSIGAETAWSAGGGGFSDTFAIPDYQKEAVAAYKSNPGANLPPQSYWNNTGRGYPDVAALGGTKTPYCVAVRGSFFGVAGTSASCPVVAGVFAKLNGLRLAAGKPVLGFLNPFIYKNPSGFQDVTSGCNTGGGRYGFTAVKGWDAATGYGTPDFDALSQLVMAAVADKTIVV